MSIVLNSVAYNWTGFDRSGTSRWSATASGVASGFSDLTNRTTYGSATAKGESALSKVKWLVKIPVVSTESSPCACPGAVLRTAYLTVLGDFGATATEAERVDALARLRALVLTTEFEQSFVTLSQPAGG